jgi:hypothetical protein
LRSAWASALPVKSPFLNPPKANSARANEHDDQRGG